MVSTVNIEAIHTLTDLLLTEVELCYHFISQYSEQFTVGFKQYSLRSE